MRHNADINFHARSMKNGICFYSNKYEGYGSYAYIDDSGNIVTCWKKEKMFEEFNSTNQNGEAKRKELKYFIPIILLFVYIAIEILKTDSFRIEMRMTFLFLWFVTLYFFGIRTFLDKKDNPDSFRFHAAEHMCINAYEDLGRVPTIDEIKKYSRFCNSCGTNLMILVGVIFLINASCTFLKCNDLYWISCAIVLSIITIILNHFGIFNIFQRLTTSVPTERELFVAIVGMELWDKIENEIE